MNGFASRIPKMSCMKSQEMGHRKYQLSSTADLHTGRFWLNLYQGPRNIFFAKIWHYMVLMALQDTKKSMRYWKRPTKVEKVILKARESKNGKMVIFFAFCDHLITKIKGIQYFDVSRSKRPKRLPPLLERPKRIGVKLKVSSWCHNVNMPLL